MLTDREREILTLIAQGKNNHTIARQLSLSPKTIADHVSNIFSKLQVADRWRRLFQPGMRGWPK